MATARKPHFDRDSVKRFEADHGRRPRGRGGWAFRLYKQRQYNPDLFTVTDSYTSAKQRAMAYAAQNGYDFVALAP